MVNIVTIGGAKNLSLSELNTLVTQNEDILGPLTGIGNDGSQTTLSFDTDQNPPAKHAAITVDASGQPVVPAGANKICEGTVFIAGTLTAASASR